MRTLVFLLAFAAQAQTLHITRGAAPYQVWQRDATNTASIRLEGSGQSADGRAVELRLLAAGRPLSGFDWKSAGKVVGGAWTAELKAVPVGGPYRLELRAAGAAAVTTLDHLLVGDLWIMAGQSNMEGYGILVNLPLPSALVNSFDMTDIWVAAADPLHRLPDSLDRVHWRRDAQRNPVKLEGEELARWIAARAKGSGLGLPFALEMVRRTGVPIGLIPCAHGGTSMDQWSPALKDQGGDSLYGAMLRRFNAAGGRVAGVLWYQGESDTGTKSAPLFEQKFRDFIAAVRSDFKQPDLPFYYVQIGRYVSETNPAEWNLVQDVQRRLESEIPRTGMVTCADCSLDDIIHIGTDDNLRLGRRLARLVCHDLFPDRSGCAALRRGPRPISARLDGSAVTVEFAEVNGRLMSAGRLNGFTIRDEKGAYLPLVYRQRVSASRPNAVELLIGGKLPPGAAVWYGQGKDPYVNLTDEQDMAAPVFGPLTIQQ